jgi:hypothetical protein
VNGRPDIVVLYAGEIEDGLILGISDDAKLVALVRAWLQADDALQAGVYICNEERTVYQTEDLAGSDSQSDARAGPRELAVMRFRLHGP